MKSIIIARVSTDEQKENSPDAQLFRMRSYCNNHNFEILKEFSFVESAYKIKRDEFDDIVEYIQQVSKKEKIAICFDKVDRLSRNIFDKRVALLYEKSTKDEIELHFVSDNQVINDKMSAGDKFAFNMKLGLSKYYSDAIGDNVRRVFEQKLRAGEWTGRAPIGYKNVALDEERRLRKDIIPDTQNAHLIEKAFNLYSTGGYSLKTLKEEMDKLGLRGKSGKRVTISLLHHTLKNPFYSGRMLSKGIEYPHRYETLISPELHQKCLDVLGSYKKKPFKIASKPFIFRGLIKCSKCGCMVTPEIKKGKFIYYSCTNYKGICKRQWVREEELLVPIYEVLENIQLSQDKIDIVVEELKKNHEDKKDFHKKAIDALNKDYSIIQNRVNGLIDLLADKSITKEEYDRKIKQYKEDQYEITLKLNEYTTADHQYYITAGTVLNLARKAKEIFDSSEVTEKRQLLNFLLQNCLLNGRKIEFSLRKPFNSIVKYSQYKTLLPG